MMAVKVRRRWRGTMSLASRTEDAKSQEDSSPPDFNISTECAFPDFSLSRSSLQVFDGVLLVLDCTWTGVAVPGVLRPPSAVSWNPPSSWRSSSTRSASSPPCLRRGALVMEGGRSTRRPSRSSIGDRGCSGSRRTATPWAERSVWTNWSPCGLFQPFRCVVKLGFFCFNYLRPIREKMSFPKVIPLIFWSTSCVDRVGGDVRGAA